MTINITEKEPVKIEPILPQYRMLIEVCFHKFRSGSTIGLELLGKVKNIINKQTYLLIGFLNKKMNDEKYLCE